MKKLLLVLLILFSCNSANAAHTDIIASIKPLHSLVENLIDGTKITADVMVDGSASPHDFALKPKQIEAINNAKLVFYIDENFETFLNKAIENLPSNVAQYGVIDNVKLKLLKPRKQAIWKDHEHEHEHGHNHEHEHHHAGEYDLHVWLSVNNTKLISEFLAKEISNKFPDDEAKIQANLKELKTKLDRLNTKLAVELEPFKNKPYIMFHDAFQYFESDYNLGSVGAITIDPEQVPNPKRLIEIKDKMAEINAKCVFSEPQFDAKLVKTVIDGTDAKTGILDESGASFNKGKNLYFDLINQIAENLKSCLG
jgi:zinc transport system substrate-binding protein